MPTYQYRCTKCAHNFEIEQRISAEPLKECPACKTESLKRVIGNVGLAFNASGFYITDSRQTNNSTSAANKSSSQK